MSVKLIVEECEGGNNTTANVTDTPIYDALRWERTLFAIRRGLAEFDGALRRVDAAAREVRWRDA